MRPFSKLLHLRRAGLRAYMLLWTSRWSSRCAVCGDSSVWTVASVVASHIACPIALALALVYFNLQGDVGWKMPLHRQWSAYI